MSTKCSIAHGDEFHLYNESGEDDCVYLRLNTLRGLIVEEGEATLRIPIHIWECVRQHPGTRLRLATMTTAQVRAEVEKETDELIRDYAAARKNRKTTRQYFGFMKLWGADQPRETQIAAALKKQLAERAQQRRVVARAAKLMRENPVRARER